jgi:lipopolysaccharide heptosyltransferase II
MKSLQVLPSLEVGGVERGVIDLARAMKKRGEEMVVLSSGGPLVAELQKMGVTHYTLPVHRKSIFSLSLVPRIAEIIEKEHIDIVHARSRVPAWLAWLAARRTNRPFVTTCHGYYSQHLLSQVMGWGKRVIVISNVIGRHMIDDFSVSPEKIRLIHRGVDLAQFSTVSKTWDAPEKRSFRIINIGRLSPIKGQVEFLKAVHEMRRHFPALEVWMVGSEHKSKHKYSELIEKTIRQLNLESCVKLLGTRRDIPELLAQSDLLVLPTLVPEAFGRVIIEAGAVGTPVIATALGGVLDIIESGKNGLLVTPGDIKGMAEAMKEILQNKKKAREFAANLKEKVTQQFTLEKMTDETLNVYKEAAADKKILMIKLGALGDLILAVPSFRMMRKRFPKAHIAVLVDRKLAGLVIPSPYLDEVIPIDRHKLSKFSYLLKTARRLRREGFDISVDLQNSKWTHLLAWLGGAAERYGFSRGPFRLLLNHPDHTHDTADAPVRHQYRIISKLGIREFDESLELWAEAGSERRAQQLLWTPETGQVKRIGLVVGSSPKWPTKRWPAESFIELSKRLTKEFKCEIVLMGSEGEGLPASLFENEKNVINLIGKTSLSDLVSVVRRLDVLVTGDTAPLHIAAASQIPVVALFGPTDPKRHMPPAKSSLVLVKNLSCQPCYSGTCKNTEALACLKQISVQEVFQAVQRQISKKNIPISV